MPHLFFWSCYIYPCVNYCLKNIFFGMLGFLSVILKEDIVIACERIYISSLLILGWKWIIFLKVCFIPQQNSNEVWIQSIPAYKTYLHVTGIIVHFSELSRCIRKLNWSDSRSPSCFWLIELCERNKKSGSTSYFLLIENTLRIVHLLIPANWVDIGSTSQFLLIS